MPYMIGGRQVQLSHEPRVINGPVFIPLTEVVQQLGGEVSWDHGSKTAGAKVNGRHARIPTQGDPTFTVDGQPQSMSVPAFLEDDTTWVPIEFFGMAFGVPVYADVNTNTVTVDTGNLRMAA